MQKKHSRVLILILLSLIPGLLFLFREGLYWDDWSQLFCFEKFGVGAFWEYFSYDRPPSAWTDILYFSLLGGNTIAWHLLFLGLKTALTLLFDLLNRRIFPENENLTFTASILFALCPVFSQQYIPIAYSQHYTDFCLWFLSAYMLLSAVESGSTLRKMCFQAVSLILTAAHMSISEYFVLLDLLKLPLVYLALDNRRRQPKENIGKALRCFIPTLLLFGGYVFYHGNLDRWFPITELDAPALLELFLEDPVRGITHGMRLLSEGILDGFTCIPRSILTLTSVQVLSKKYMLLICLGLLISGGCFPVLEKTTDTGVISRNKLVWVMIFALVWIAAGVLPFAVIEDTVSLTDDLPHSDRACMAAMPGFCLFFAALLHAVSLSRRQHALFASALSFVFCFGLLVSHQRGVEENALQQSFFQQTAIRLGGLQNNTALVSNAVLFPNQGNFSTAAAINVLFPDGIEENGNVPFWIFGYDTRTFQQHGGFDVKKRNYRFTAVKENMIYLDRDNRFGNCVWFFDPEDTDNPHVTDHQRTWIEHSATDRIDLDRELTPEKRIFGTQGKNWCLYYQTAERLWQKKDYPALAELTEEVLAAGFSPEDSRSDSPFEWWPFIAGTYVAGNAELAEDLAARAVRVDPAYQEFYASRMERLRQ